MTLSKPQLKETQMLRIPGIIRFFSHFKLSRVFVLAKASVTVIALGPETRRQGLPYQGLSGDHLPVPSSSVP